MKVGEIAALLEELAPLRYACDWDNSGMKAGDPGQEVHKLYLAFDSDLQTIREAADAGADMLVTHHPLAFAAEKDFSADTLLGQKLQILFSHHMAAYGMHTSFDAVPGGMADLAAERLGLKNCRYLIPQEDGGIGIIGELPQPVTAEAFCGKVKEAFSLPYIQLFDRRAEDKPVSRVAVLPGAGGGDWEEALSVGAELYLTGDLKHHDILDALDSGLVLADAGHYGLEWIFLEKLSSFLKENLPADVELLVQQRRFPGRIL